MDPITLALLLGLGGSAVQGVGQMFAAGRQGAARRRRAAKLEDIAGILQSGALDLGEMDVAPLREALSQQLGSQLGTQRAQLQMQGLGGSGVAGQLAANAQALAQGQFAQAITADQLQRAQLEADDLFRRQQAVAGIYSDPVFGDSTPSPFEIATQALGGGLGAAGQLAGTAGMNPDVDWSLDLPWLRGGGNAPRGWGGYQGGF